ncbi:MAG: hypothetical protein R3185_08575 [Candidatus Thermoplasmatota archaeon]|nr:hypothetical protein [Candidatus Thermoplasmatota archaeon]
MRTPLGVLLVLASLLVLTTQAAAQVCEPSCVRTDEHPSDVSTTNAPGPDGTGDPGGVPPAWAPAHGLGLLVMGMLVLVIGHRYDANHRA